MSLPRPNAAKTTLRLMAIGMGLVLVALSCSEDKPDPQTGKQGGAAQQVQPAPKPTTPVRFADGCLTSACHTSHQDAAFIHAPVAAKRCDLCHADDTGKHEYPLLDDNDQLCKTCHEIGDSKLYKHGALDTLGCHSCHEAHVGKTRALLKNDDEAASCAECHLVTQGPVRHPPYEQAQCSTCHDPHESNDADLLQRESEEQLCGQCHDTATHQASPDSLAHTNQPVPCTSCHTAHASHVPTLLKQTTATLCLECHKEIADRLKAAPNSHKAVLTGSQCLTCHVAHSSSEASMLKGDQASVCLDCHKKEVEATDGRKIQAMTADLLDTEFQHGPIKSRNCTACHEVHGSREAHLLQMDSSVEMTGDFDKKYYSHCFGCHEKQLVTEPKTRISTQFRDGNKNLHFVHVQNRGRGNSCTTCHAVHGSNQGRHIARSVFYSGSAWKMKLDYKATAKGGTCTTDCHEEIPYSREAPDRLDEESAPSKRPEIKEDKK